MQYLQHSSHSRYLYNYNMTIITTTFTASQHPTHHAFITLKHHNITPHHRTTSSHCISASNNPYDSNTQTAHAGKTRTLHHANHTIPCKYRCRPYQKYGLNDMSLKCDQVNCLPTVLMKLDFTFNAAANQRHADSLHLIN